MSDETVKAGEPLTTWFQHGGLWRKWNADQITIAPSCGGKPGRWYCLTHDEVFPNNLTTDGHIESAGHHVMAWLCPDHGVETP